MRTIFGRSIRQAAVIVRAAVARIAAVASDFRDSPVGELEVLRLSDGNGTGT
jgi:hypothetical protein